MCLQGQPCWAGHRNHCSHSVPRLCRKPAKFSQGLPAARKLQLLRTGSTCTGEQKCSPLGSAHCSAELQLPPGVFSPGCLMPPALPYFSFSNKQHSLGDALKRWTPFKLWIKPNGVPTHALTCLIKAHFTWWLPVYNFFLIEIKPLLEDIILEYRETWQSNTQAVNICYSTLILHREMISVA